MTGIRYIWHDCFVVNLPQANMVFDYWVDCDGAGRDIPGFLSDLDRNKPLYVFVSHFHKDHYNPSIFGWVKEFTDIRYIVSIDVWKRMRHIVSPTSVYKGPRVDARQVTVLRPASAITSVSANQQQSQKQERHHEYSDGIVTVTAYPSTDTGNSYLVETGGQTIFHAGDLNAWIWKDESTPSEVNKAIGDFRSCIRQIKTRRIDWCFFPVDSRIGRDYWEGARIFVREFDVAHFFPMHFALGDDEERRQRARDAVDFPSYANPERGEYIPLISPGETYFKE